MLTSCRYFTGSARERASLLPVTEGYNALRMRGIFYGSLAGTVCFGILAWYRGRRYGVSSPGYRACLALEILCLMLLMLEQMIQNKQG